MPQIWGKWAYFRGILPILGVNNTRFAVFASEMQDFFVKCSISF